jgi:CRP-like cAMP-binding protein
MPGSGAAADPRLTPDDLFRRHPLLGALEADDKRELLRRAQTRNIRAGQTLFRKDDAGDGLYGVMSGRIVITVESATGKELILNTFGPGTFFGEITLLDGKGRTGTAVAREASQLLFLARAVFLPFLERRPATAIRVIAFLCEQLRRTTQLVEDSAFLNVPTRLAKQLVVMAQDYGRREASGAAVSLSISQAELAQMLGVSREIVSRQLAVWREAGIIDVARNRVVVRDLTALDDIVAGG